MKKLVLAAALAVAVPAWAADIPEVIQQEINWARAQKLAQYKERCSKGNAAGCSMYEMELKEIQRENERRAARAVRESQPCPDIEVVPLNTK